MYLVQDMQNTMILEAQVVDDPLQTDTTEDVDEDMNLGSDVYEPIIPATSPLTLGWTKCQKN